jgi:hypothetical protein
MKTELTLVSPELAARWLANNPRNRKVNRHAVDAFELLIKSGEWRVTHQGPAIGEDGCLQDGQHRLLAVVKSGIAVLMNVSFDVPMSAMDAIDTGGCGTRKPHEVIAIADGTHTSKVFRLTVNAADRIVSGVDVGGSGKKQTVAELREAIRVHGESAQAVIDAVGAYHDRIAQAPINGALAILHRLYPSEVVRFGQLLRSGTGMHERHPVHVLRQFVLLRYCADGRGSREDLANRTFSAFDAFRRGSDRQIVRASPNARAEAVEQWKAIVAR